MAKPPRIGSLRENDLGIKDAPPTAHGLREAFRRLFAQVNPYFDGLNKLTAKGISPSENLRCDLVSAKFSHGAAQTIALHDLQVASGAVILGCDGQLPIAANVRMTGKQQCSVTIWFNDPRASSVAVKLLLLEDGQQSATVPGFLPIMATPTIHVVYVGDGTAWQPLTLPDCPAGQALAYSQSTKTFSAFTPSSGGWVTAYTLDFSVQATQNLLTGGDGAKTIDGKTWNAVNTGGASTFGITNGTGLTITRNAVGTNPALQVPLSTLTSASADRDNVQLWTYFTKTMVAGGFCGTGFGWGSGHATLTDYEVLCGPNNTGTRIVLVSGGTAGPDVTVGNNTDDIIVITRLDMARIDTFTGVSSGGSFPAASSLSPRGTYSITTQNIASHPAVGNVGFQWVAADANTVSLVLKKIKVLVRT